MRVVVNQLASLGMKTGIGHYTAELFRCLRAQAEMDVIEGFPQGLLRTVREAGTRVRPILEGKGQSQLASHPGPSQMSWRSKCLRYLRKLGRKLTARQFRWVCSAKKYDLYHEPNFIPLPSDLPTVATLHDLSVLVHPEWHPADRVAWFERNFQRGLNRCRHFLAISEAGRQEIIRTLNISPERVTRTYMGIRGGLGPMPSFETTKVLRQLGLPAEYLLSLGTIEPRKNLIMLLKAYCGLPDTLRSRMPLLLVGGWGWNAAEVAEYLDKVGRHKGVIHVGYVAENHLAAIYNGARALVYPSLYEGFGLPPIEMMACGGAVLASTADALVETVGSHAHLIAANDIDGWRDGMERVIQDEDWCQFLRTGVTTVAEPYTWESCAADTLSAYWKVLGMTGMTDTASRAGDNQLMRIAG